ncbi:hypothetical protein [Halosimplex carlsbadense]|uniref:hypothetical protein n=1 Tax=Halosimplex carlsbadense TaxID=171164 RepID=UPI001268438D|nr:hypothetical protein [Halosimplex carlsbadense]
MSQQEQRTNWPCPHCDSSDVFPVEGTDGLYRCDKCGGRTHDKIEENREALEDLAESDLPVADVAETLLGGDSA